MTTGKVFKYGDNVDTDVIIPARYLNAPDPAELAKHCMEDIDADYVDRVRPGDIIVGGANFGCGSSREHAVYCLKYAGVPCLLTENCARIYYRNCISNAYPVLFINGLSKAIADGDIKDGDELEVNMDAGVIKDLSNGKEFHGDAVSDLERDIMAAGGIFQYMKQQAAKK